MADLGAALSSELTRIAESTFPALLCGLDELLSRANVFTVRASLQDRSPCAVSKLATIVYHALEPQACALRVLYWLCHAPEFRDELLLLNPGLLNFFLTKANSSRQAFENYVELCVLLLSRPLPETIALPAASQNFFLNVFERACQEPNVDTVKPVYYMLNGACRQLRSLLPSDTQRRFDSELCRILGVNTAGKASMLLLWTSGTVLFAEHPQGVQHVHNPRSSSEPPVSTENLKQQWVTKSGQKLFGSSKDLHKTILLTCLNVMWVLKGEVADDEAVEGIRIASRVLQAIDRDVIDSWSGSDPKCNTVFEKFPSKIQGLSASSPVLFEALSFYAVLSGSKKMPQEIVALYESSMSELACIADPDRVSETLSVAIPNFAPHTQESTIQVLISNVLEACASRPSSRQLSNLIHLVDELTTATSSSSVLRTKVLHALSSQTLQGKLRKFIETNPEDKGVNCCTHAVSLQRQLVSAIIASLLTIALAVQPEEPTIPCTLTSALINKQRTLPPILDRCLHSSDSPKSPSISLFQQANTPSTGQHLEDWRKRLNSELESQDAYKRDAILRSVGKVCGDLEARCKTVEEPLRREKEKSVRLEELIVQLQNDVESLQARIVDNGCYQEILERERDEALEDKERTCTKFHEIEASFTESKRHANEALRTAQEKFSAKELELRSAVLEYEEELRTRGVEAEALRGTINQLEESQAQQDIVHHTLKDQCAQLQTRLSDTEQLLHSERENMHRQVDENAHLKDQNRNCADRLEGMEAELEHVTRQLNDLTTSHQQLEVNSEETLKSLKAKHANEMEDAAVKAEAQRKALITQLQNALQDCQYEKDNHEKTQRHVQDLKASVPPLESRIQDLEDLCSEQEGELEELRTIRRNILVGLGVMPQKPMAIRSSSRSQQDAAESETPRDSRSHQRRKSAINAQNYAPKATTGTQEFADTAMENLTNASFASSEPDTPQGGGPAPKRPKPRSSFKVPSMHTPYTQKPNLTSNSLSRKLSPSKRSALRQMSPNRRHTNAGFAVAENEEEGGVNVSEVVMKRRGSLQDMEQADFDMDDEFMAGTPLTQGNFMSGTGRMPEEEDETATEL